MSDKQARIFARLTKIDVAKRMVYGRAVAEEVDKSNEIFDYSQSKPYFEAWSAGIAKDTDGKSLGNIRAMHGKVAAGKVAEIDFNDTAKAIDIGAKIVDNAEWEKCLEGVYTGFSIGGKYVEGSRKTEKVDGKDVTRYAADPIEISLVDRPMIPSCKFFEVQRADGSVAKVDFQDAEAKERTFTVTDAAGKELGKVELEKTLKDGDELTLAIGGKDTPLTVTKVVDHVITTKPRVEEFEIEGSEEDVARLLAVMKSGSLKIGEVIAAAERAARLKPMMVAVAPPALKPEALKIAERAVELSRVDKVVAYDDAAKLKYEGIARKELYAQLRKGLVCVASFAYLIDALRDLQEKVEYEQILENDVSTLPARLKACIALCGEVLGEMVKEEIQEIGEDRDDGNRGMYMTMAERSKLKKRYDSGRDAVLALLALAKAFPPKDDKGGDGGGNGGQQDGQQQDQGDAEFAAKLHAVAIKLGAKCDTGGGQQMKVAAGDVQKLLGTPEIAEALKAAVATATEPLTKRIQQLENEPRAPRIRLRAVSKGEDLGDDTPAPQAAVVKNADGSVNESASLIKQAHRTGGRSLLPGTEGKQ